MNLPAQPARLLTRKELSALSGLSYQVIGRNEESLGLVPCKIVVNARLIFYREADALNALRVLGILEFNGTVLQPAVPN